LQVGWLIRVVRKFFAFTEDLWNRLRRLQWNGEFEMLLFAESGIRARIGSVAFDWRNSHDSTDGRCNSCRWWWQWHRRSPDCDHLTATSIRVMWQTIVQFIHSSRRWFNLSVSTAPIQCVRPSTWDEKLVISTLTSIWRHSSFLSPPLHRTVSIQIWVSILDTSHLR
jgi:hypothetical protein